MKQRKTIFLGIAFGTSVRDVLRTDTFRTLKAQKDIDIVVFLQDTTISIQEEIGGENVYIEKLYDFEPTKWERMVLHIHRALLREKCRTIDLGNTGADTNTIDKITPSASSRLSRISASMRSSNVARVMRRCTCTARFWPMR